VPRELLILRHAKSDWGSGATADFDRALALRGRKDAKAVGRWLRHQARMPGRILASPARRAQQTALRLCRAARIPETAIVWTPAIYEASLGTLLHLLAADAGDHPRVMLVGHNPGLEELLVHLAGETVVRPPDGKLLPTAALAWLEMPEDWHNLSRGSGTLRSVTRPRELRR
jgi:phosphohistidine phosphatase